MLSSVRSPLNSTLIKHTDGQRESLATKSKLNLHHVPKARIQLLYLSSAVSMSILANPETLVSLLPGFPTADSQSVPDVLRPPSPTSTRSTSTYYCVTPLSLPSSLPTARKRNSPSRKLWKITNMLSTSNPQKAHEDVHRMQSPTLHSCILPLLLVPQADVLPRS